MVREQTRFVTMATGKEREPARSSCQMAASIKDLVDFFPEADDKPKLLHLLKGSISKCPRKQLQEDLKSVNLQKFFATFPTLDE